MMMTSRIKISLIVAVLALCLVVIAYVYSLWSVDRQKQADLPVEAVSMMMRDLLAFHDKRGGFPEDLGRLEGVIWKPKERMFSIKKRALNHRNYYYFYSRINHHQFTLWAIPTGNSREESPTWFLVVTPNSCHRWKGAALPFDQVDRIESNPAIRKLGMLGLVEQETINLRTKQKAAKIFPN